MVYTFACPVPCHRVIKVYANADDDAINELIVAGAMSCRNTANQKYCEKCQYDMPSLPEEQLREIVRLSMESESVYGTRMMSETMTKTLEGSLYNTAGTL
jgi:hypothetical protein